MKQKPRHMSAAEMSATAPICVISAGSSEKSSFMNEGIKGSDISITIRIVPSAPIMAVTVIALTFVFFVLDIVDTGFR